MIGRGSCYQPKPEADNTNRGTDNSRMQKPNYSAVIVLLGINL